MRTKETPEKVKAENKAYIAVYRQMQAEAGIPCARDVHAAVYEALMSVGVAGLVRDEVVRILEYRGKRRGFTPEGIERRVSRMLA